MIIEQTQVLRASGGHQLFALEDFTGEWPEGHSRGWRGTKSKKKKKKKLALKSGKVERDWAEVQIRAHSVQRN